MLYNTILANVNILDIFQGPATLVDQLSAGEYVFGFGRIGLILLGFLMIYLGRKGVLEGLLMIPMGLGMIAVNAGNLILPVHTPVMAVDDAKMLTELQKDDPNAVLPEMPYVSVEQLKYLKPVMETTEIGNMMVRTDVETETLGGVTAVMNWLQIYCFQPIYVFTFANGLIACFIFMGIGALLDVGYVLARPFQSMFVALCAEAGTILTLPIIMALSDMPVTYAASIAMVGCADGPMVLFTSLQLAKEIFAPLTVVAYLYLGLCYGGYPYLLKWLIPERLRALPAIPDITVELTSSEKLAFAVLACFVLCFLLPVASPLLLSLFLGIAVKEAELKDFHDLLAGPVLYFSTLILGLILGTLCGANVMFSSEVMVILIFGILSLLISGLGGIAGGYIMYFFTGGKFNPVIGIAGVSCVPTNAKVAQKCVSKANPAANIMPQALGVNISGVITSAIICGIYVALLKQFV